MAGVCDAKKLNDKTFFTVIVKLQHIKSSDKQPQMFLGGKRKNQKILPRKNKTISSACKSVHTLL